MSLQNCKLIGSNISYDKSREGRGERGEKGYVMSRSELIRFAENPSKWLAGFGKDDEGTKATDWGSLIDCLLTSPDDFEKRFAIPPPEYPVRDKKGNETGEMKPWNANSTWCGEWVDDHAGFIIVKSDILEEAHKAVAQISATTLLTELYALSSKQVMVTGQWKDRTTGLVIPLVALLDLVPPKGHAVFGKWLVDGKTARNGNPAGWPRVIDDDGLDVQGALYMDMYCAATGEDRTDFVHVVQESVAPYHVVTPFPAMTSEFLAWGRIKYQSALAKYAQCLATGVWPSYEPAGMVYGQTQLIGPDELWSYKKSAGGVGRSFGGTPEPTLIQQSQDTKNDGRE